MYPKMELVEYNIAISKCINGKSSKVDHYLFSFLVFPKAMARDATISQHIVDGVDRKTSKFAITLNCDMWRIQSY